MITDYNKLPDEIKNSMQCHAVSFIGKGSINEKIIEKDLLWENKKSILAIFKIDKMGGFHGLR